MKQELKQKYSVVLLLVVLLSGFFSPITAYAVSESGNFADVPDDHYEKANLLVALEEELVEIGLSLEIFANTSIDFENLQYQSLLPAEERSERNLPAVTPVVPFEFPKVKQFATRIYGNNPTNDQLMHTFMLYYFDVHDYERNAGLVGDRLPLRYYPEYYTFNDTNAYNAFLRTTTGAKYLNFALSSYDTVISLKDYFSNLDIYNLKNHVSNVKKSIAGYKTLEHGASFIDAIHKYFTEEKPSLESINSPEKFMEEISKIIDTQETIDQASKKALKGMYDTVLDSVFLLLMGANPIGIAGIATMYVTAMATMYVSIIDLAAINTLAGTRNSRLNFRQLNNWGMW